MKYDPNKHHRRSTRLKGYDYAQPGAYFITICTYQRKPIFGEIVDGGMVLNVCGEILQNTWKDLPNHYPHVVLDEFCIMPNHIHGIVVLTEMHPGRGGSETRPYDQSTRPYDQSTRPCDRQNINRHGLPEIVRALKSFSSRRINLLLDSPGVPVWQRNYYEHIIRNEDELNAVRSYIQNNPLKWDLDQDNPINLISTKET